MINNIHSTGKYMQVTGSNSRTYVNNYSGSQGVGNMRYNTTNQRIEIYDGTTWIMLNMSDSFVGLNGEAEMLLDWARKKRDEELLMQSLMEKHPGLKEAYERLEIMKALTLEEENAK